MVRDLAEVSGFGLRAVAGLACDSVARWGGDGQSSDDALVYSGRCGVLRKGLVGLEMKVAFHVEAQRVADRSEFGEADITEFGKTHPQITQAEEGIEVGRIHLGDKPGGSATRVEELDDREIVVACLAVADEFFL